MTLILYLTVPTETIIVSLLEDNDKVVQAVYHEADDKYGPHDEQAASLTTISTGLIRLFIHELLFFIDAEDEASVKEDKSYHHCDAENGADLAHYCYSVLHLLIELFMVILNNIKFLVRDHS